MEGKSLFWPIFRIFQPVILIYLFLERVFGQLNFIKLVYKRGLHPAYILYFSHTISQYVIFNIFLLRQGLDILSVRLDIKR